MLAAYDPDWRKYWWQPGFASAFFTVGLPYWLIPYNTISLPDAIIGTGLVVVVASALLARAYSGKSFSRWRGGAGRHAVGQCGPVVIAERTE